MEALLTHESGCDTRAKIWPETCKCYCCLILTNTVIPADNGKQIWALEIGVGKGWPDRACFSAAESVGSGEGTSLSVCAGGAGSEP